MQLQVCYTRRVSGATSRCCQQRCASTFDITVTHKGTGNRKTYLRTALSLRSDADTVSQDASKNEPPSVVQDDDDDDDETGTSQVHLATGFPVPLPRYPRVQKPESSELRQHLVSMWARRRSQQQALESEREQEKAAQAYHDSQVAGKKKPVQPVFRASPYKAEVQRALKKTAQASILFVDEGNHCRSVLAEAVFNEVLVASPLQRFIKTDAASIGPSFRGGHDSRVMWAAQKAGLTLAPRNCRPFDEQADIVNYDLVLTMDHFDMQEVHREVAVFDAINPGGGYSSRVQQLGSFAPTSNAQQGMFAEDISDPLYGNSGGAQERQALLAAVHQLRLACRGLLSRLLALHARCGSTGKTLQQAIAQSMQDPSHMPDGVGVNGRYSQGGTTWRPVWRKNGTENAENFYTIRMVQGQRQIIKRRSTTWGYWSDARNVRQELDNFMKAHPAKTPGKLPSQAQMRRAGCNSLSFAITRHGGYAALFARVPSQHKVMIGQRRERGYFNEFSTLARELQAYLQPVSQPRETQGLHQPGPVKAEEFAPDGSRVSYKSFSGGQSSESRSSPSKDEHLGAASSDNGSGDGDINSNASEKGVKDLKALRSAGTNTSAVDGAQNSSSNGSNSSTVSCKGSSAGDDTSATDGVHSIISSSSSASSHGGVYEAAGQLKMPAQAELVEAGRTDIIHGIRLWGGSTAVADRLGVLPNTRHKRSNGDLRQEMEVVIREQGWEPGRMPRAGELQAAGKHRLVAAIRIRGGFRDIATQLGLTPAPADRRGRPKKQKAVATVEQQQQAEPAEEQQQHQLYAAAPPLEQTSR